jgi:hypothetical protein
MTKKVKTTTEEVIQDEPVREKEDTDRKGDRFFNYFREEENYVITLYRVKERGKIELVDKFENQVPDLLKIRENWGGGTYKLYAHDFENNFLDSTVIHVADVPEGKISGGDNEETFLMKALKYKELLGGGNNNQNEIMLKMMEMQQQFTHSISQLMSKMNEKNLEAQLQIERRFTEVLEKQNVQRNGFGDLIQAAEFINMIKGDAGETSLFDKLIGNPIFQNIASGFVSNLQSNQVAPKNVTPHPAQIGEGVPKEFIDKLTRENRDKGIENVMKAYKIPRDRAETIIDALLKNKGL